MVGPRLCLTGGRLSGASGVSRFAVEPLLGAPRAGGSLVASCLCGGAILARDGCPTGYRGDAAGGRLVVVSGFVVCCVVTDEKVPVEPRWPVSKSTLRRVGAGAEET